MVKINSIGYGCKLLGLTVLFLILFPSCCYLLVLLFHTDALMTVMRISLAIGLLMSISFAVLLAIEFHQDKAIQRAYVTLKKTKLAIGNGLYECQSCGNRHVSEQDKECGVCGIYFQSERSKSI